MKSSDIRAQRGSAVLVMVAVLALCLLLIVAHASRVVVTEQRLAENDALARTSLGAAQAGLEAALASLQQLKPEDMVYDAAGWTAFAGPSGALGSGASFVTVVRNRGLTPYLSDLLEIESTGTDEGGTRVVRQMARRQPWLANPPPAPLVIRGNAEFAALGLVNRQGPIAAWTGGAFGEGAAIELAGEPRCPPQGVCASDPRMAALAPAEVFQNFLGRMPELFAALATPCNPCADGASESAVLWFEGHPATLGGAWGSAEHPAIVVASGGLRLDANTDVHGLLVVLGDWVAGPGELSVTGAMIVAGEVSGAAGRIEYAPALLEPFRATGPYARVAGSWSDF